MNNALLDTYQLKSLDGILEGDISNTRFYKKRGKIFIDLDGSEIGEDVSTDIDNFPAREGYDRVIRCLGWTFDASLFARYMDLFLCFSSYKYRSKSYEKTTL